MDHKRIVHPALGVDELDCHDLLRSRTVRSPRRRR
ncbi:hypothetical protein [Streptomyces sp. NRRL F-5650]